MSLGKRYRDVVRKQHELSAYVARLLTQFGVGVLIGSIALFIVIGGLGIVLSFKMNEDAMEVMAPVNSVYYQRLVKFSCPAAIENGTRGTYHTNFLDIMQGYI